MLLEILPPGYESLQAYFTGWAPIAFALLITATAISGVIYMIGAALANDKMKAWAKIEIFEVFYSGIIFAIALTAIASFDIVVNYIVDTSGDVFARLICSDNPNDPDAQRLMPSFTAYGDIGFCHIKLAMYFLGTIFEEMSDTAFDVYHSYIVTSTLADASINIEFVTEKAGFFTFTPWRGFLTPGNTQKNAAFEFLSKLMMITKIQEIFIGFIAEALFPTLLVAGIVLRSFMFTRRLGGLLMAMALALFFLYPMFYVFGAFVIGTIKSAACAAIPACAGNPIGYDGKLPIADFLYVNGTVPALGGTIDYGEHGEKLEQQWKQLKEKRGSEVSGLAGSGYDPSVSYDESDPNDPNAPANRGYTPSMNLLRRAHYDPTQPDYDPVDEELLNQSMALSGEYIKNLSSRNYDDKFVVEAFEEGGLVDAVARLSFFSLFFSLFAVLATIAAIRSASITLGGDVEIAGLTHLI